MIYQYARIKVQYFICGAGLFLSSAGYVINSNKDALLSTQGLGFPFLPLLTVANVLLLHILFKLEVKWMLKLKKKQTFWKMRPNVDCGIWLISVFPLALLVGSLTCSRELSPIYLITMTLTLGCLSSSFIFLYYGLQNDKPKVKLCLLLQLPFSILIAVFLNFNTSVLLSIWIGLPLTMFVQTLFLNLVVKLVSSCPLTFTIGEVVTVAQITLASISACFVWLLQRIFCLLGSLDSEHDYGAESLQFLQVLMLGSAFIAAVVSSQALFQKPLLFYSLCVATGGLAVYPAWFIVVKSEPFSWLLKFCFSSFNRILLIGLWATCVLAALFVVTWRNIHGLHATTAVRKYFHVIIVLIYFPGFIWDQEMLLLASGVALFLFFVFEMMRLLDMPPFGHILDSSLRIFLDEKDSGNLILSHIYLLLGFSIPLWILPLQYQSGFCLASLSGLLSLGFGDTAASVCGTMWGKHKLPDSKKSVEGTVSAMVIQLLVTLSVFVWADLSRSPLDILVVSLSTVLCCSMEAFTDQVDNLVLPIFLYLMLVPL